MLDLAMFPTLGRPVPRQSRLCRPCMSHSIRWEATLLPGMSYQPNHCHRIAASSTTGRSVHLEDGVPPIHLHRIHHCQSGESRRSRFQEAKYSSTTNIRQRHSSQSRKHLEWKRSSRTRIQKMLHFQFPTPLEVRRWSSLDIEHTQIRQHTQHLEG